MKKLLLVFALFNTLLASAQVDENAIAMDLVTKNKIAIGLSDQDLNNAIVSNTYFDKASNLRMVYLQQSFCSLPVYNQLQVLAFKNSILVSNTGSRIKSIEKITGGNKGIPQINAEAAVLTALSDRKLTAKSSPVVIGSEKNGHFIVFDNMGISRENITAELMWVPLEDGIKVVLAWQIYIIPNTTSDYWMVRVDAIKNTVVSVNNLTVYCNWGDPSKEASCKKNEDHHQKEKKIAQENKYSFNFGSLDLIEKKSTSPNIFNNATYRVVPFPYESPKHFVDTTAVITNPWTAAPGNATTLNWNSDGTTDYINTRGNNVWAQEDANGNNGTGTQTNSLSSTDPLNFEFVPKFTVSPSQTTPVQNQQFNVTNLFYWNNIIHDVMYQYGFDEVGGNFQANNLGRGGAENDHVLADAQDGSGTNNANFATPADGGSGRMQMYLWSGTPQKDGDVDNGVVTHEFAHGISNRLTGGPAQAGCLGNDEQMGEGWSDYYGLMFTQNWATTDTGYGYSTPRAVGTYAFGQSPTGAGIRTQKYCTNMAVNTKKYATSIPTESHDRGEIWCAVLWDMTWAIIRQEYTLNSANGINPNLYDASGNGGNIIALKLVTEGMKLQPCSPGFIDGRDAIIKADELLYGGSHVCVIREAFRRRGMGALASQGSSNSVTDQVADFSSGTASLKISSNIHEVQEGQNITFTNTLTSGSCAGVTNFKLTDTLPSNVTYVSSTNGGTYNTTNRVLSWVVNLTANQTQDYSFTVSVNSGAYFPTVTVFEDSVLNPTLSSDWTSTSSTTTKWDISNTRSYSPDYSYFSHNLDLPSDEKLTLTNAITLGATPPDLTFRHWFNSESTYDGGVLEVSTNGGTTWTDMQSNIYSGGYTTLMDTSTVLKNRRAWSGTSGNKFIRTKVRLTPYANQSIKFRFRFTSDNGTAAEGWYVDNIAIKSQALIDIQSNLFSASNVRAATVDTFAIIVPVSLCTPSSTTVPPVSVCNSYTWNGVIYTTSGIKTWTGTNAAGCDSIVTLNLTINQATTSSTSITVCSSYTWNGVTYSNSGVYTYSFPGGNANGCDSSAILNLTVNQPRVPSFNQLSPVCINSSFSLPSTSTNGISGSWSPAPNNQTTTTYTFTPNAGQCALPATMTVTVNATPTVPTFTQIAAICKNGNFTLPTTSLEGVSGTWSPAVNNQSTTTYTFTPTTGACATTTTITVEVKQPSSSVASPVTACSSYTWNGTTYTTSGIKTWTGTNAVGCDSTVSIIMLIYSPSVSNSSVSVCSTYDWNGFTYTSSGTYTWMGTNSVGCDSTAILNLTIKQPTTSTSNVSICSTSLPYSWNNTNYNASGTYTKTGLTNIAGCDSTAYLVLTVNTTPITPTFNQVAAICKNGSFNLPLNSTEGVTGTWSPAPNNQTTTTYTFTPSAGQCALTTTMTVSIKQPSSSVESPVTACSSYTWYGLTYTTSGIKTWTGTNTEGCDSVVTINIKINSPSTSSSSATACSSYIWNGVTYTTSGIKTWTGVNSGNCDSTATLNLTINQPVDYDTTITSTGFYTWIVNGVNQTLYQSGNYKDSSCGIKILRLTIRANTVVYPSPTNGAFNINLAALNNNLTNDLVLNKNVTITVYDAIGKKVLTQKIVNVFTDKLSIRNCSGGIYFIKIQSTDKSINYSTKIFKTN